MPDKLCPDEEMLACFVEGLLDDRERGQIRQHLFKCSRCREAVIISFKIKISDDTRLKL